VLVTDFNYILPRELVAQVPLPDRAGARMLHLRRDPAQGKPWLSDGTFRDIVELLRPSDLLVLNNTKVFPARLFGRRSGSKSQPISPRNPASKEFLQGEVEVLLTRHLDADHWQALVRPGRKIGVGESLYFPDKAGEVQLEAEIIGRGEFGERSLRFVQPSGDSRDFFDVLDHIGHVPLPPYIDRSDANADRERYQTVFAKHENAGGGSAAAPTAGLHFTPEVLEQIHARGIETAEITLHVGLGTFQPLRHERVEDNKLHTEPFSISASAAKQINDAKSSGRRVIAVGTTAVRALEYAAMTSPSGEVQSQRAEADIFIYPGFHFRVVDALLTNFHLPQSSLLMLVCAFAGRERVLQAYEHAVKQKYRFFSYGDCMFVE
jgi:S-adenosylmethionine:tRNA ribosyltransferase-isomerase